LKREGKRKKKGLDWHSTLLRSIRRRRGEEAVGHGGGSGVPWEEGKGEKGGKTFAAYRRRGGEQGVTDASEKGGEKGGEKYWNAASQVKGEGERKCIAATSAKKKKEEGSTLMLATGGGGGGGGGGRGEYARLFFFCSWRGGRGGREKRGGKKMGKGMFSTCYLNTIMVQKEGKGKKKGRGVLRRNCISIVAPRGKKKSCGCPPTLPYNPKEKKKGGGRIR